MAINLSALSQAANKAVSLSNLILVSPQGTKGYQPQNAPSWKKDTSALPKAILFNYEGEQTAQLTSDITDHYIENNTAIQDQIALKPEIITTRGFVGELNDIAPALLEPLKIAAEKLTPISAYAPVISTSALLAYANAFQAYQVASNLANTAVAAWASINGGQAQSVINGSGIEEGSNQTQQQKYFSQFYAYWDHRQLFTIQTPWAVFQDMAIQSLRAIQSEETRMISDFEVTFKRMRFASTLDVTEALYGDNSAFESRAANQGAKVVDLGTSTLEASPISFGSLLG